MTKRTPFVIQFIREATAATTFVGQTLPFAPNMNLVITDIAVTNEDDDDKCVSVGIKRQGTDYYIETLNITTAGYFYHCKCNVVAPSDSRVIARFISPSDGDTYVVNVFGYLEEKL